MSTCLSPGGILEARVARIFLIRSSHFGSRIWVQLLSWRKAWLARQHSRNLHVALVHSCRGQMHHRHDEHGIQPGRVVDHAHRERVEEFGRCVGELGRPDRWRSPTRRRRCAAQLRRGRRCAAQLRRGRGRPRRSPLPMRSLLIAASMLQPLPPSAHAHMPREAEAARGTLGPGANCDGRLSGVSRAGLPKAAAVSSWCMPRVRSLDKAGQSSAMPFVPCSNRWQASLKRGREDGENTDDALGRDGRCLLERGWFRALEDPGRHEAFARLPSGKLAIIGGTSRTCTRDSRWPPGGLAPLLAGRPGAGRGDVVLAVPPLHRGDACALQVLGLVGLQDGAYSGGDHRPGSYPSSVAGPTHQGLSSVYGLMTAPPVSIESIVGPVGLSPV